MKPSSPEPNAFVIVNRAIKEALKELEASRAEKDEHTLRTRWDPELKFKYGRTFSQMEAERKERIGNCITDYKKLAKEDFY